MHEFFIFDREGRSFGEWQYASHLFQQGHLSITSRIQWSSALAHEELITTDCPCI